MLITAQTGSIRAKPAKQLDLKVCTGQGQCSTPSKLPFEGVPALVEAIWLCTDQPESALEGTTVVADGREATALAAHPHLRLVAERTGSAVELRASETLDRVLVRVVTLDDSEVREILWSSSSNEDAITFATRDRVSVAIPTEIIDGCRECKVMAQATHVWRDDDVRDLSEAWLTLSLDDQANP